MTTRTLIKLYRVAFLTALMINLFAVHSYGQEQSSIRAYYLSALETTFDIDTDTIDVCDYYLLDGEALDFLQNQDFTEPQPFRSIDYILLSDEMFPNEVCDLLLIVRSDNPQSKAERKSLLQKAQMELSANKEIQALEWRCNSCKMISINQEFYSPAEGRDKIMALKARQIEEIIIYDKPMSTVLFGSEGGKNGLIVIQTK